MPNIVIERIGREAGRPGGHRGSYQALEDEHGFSRRMSSTDYRLASLDEAVVIMGCIFGHQMAETVRRRRTPIVPEFTGIRHRRYHPDTTDA